MFPRRFTACFAALLFAGLHALAQDAAPAAPAPDVTHVELPPSTIYTETIAPFERMRADLGNWSELELAAFKSATATAKAECQRLEQNPHEGEEALSLARLCSVGMDWDGTYSAARWYTRKTAPAGEAQHLAMGFGLLIQADLNLQAVQRAIEDVREAHDRLPFSADSDSIYSYAIASLDIMQPERALEVALLRQPDLLQMIQNKSNATPALPLGTAEEEAWHTLSLLHFAHRTQEEQQAKEQLLEAVRRRSTTPSVTDLYIAQRGRTHYEWLDRHVPDLRITRNTYPTAHQKSAATHLELLVIEREDAADAATLALGIDGLRSRLPPGTHATMILLKAPATLVATPPQAPTTMHAQYTSDDLLDTFSFSNGPLFLVEDEQQQVKYLGIGSSAWLNPQMQAERLVALATEKTEAP